MARDRDMPPAARQFVNGTVDTVTLPRTAVRLGYSPAQRDAAMTRMPSKRDRRRADRRAQRSALRAERF